MAETPLPPSCDRDRVFCKSQVFYVDSIFTGKPVTPGPGWKGVGKSLPGPKEGCVCLLQTEGGSRERRAGGGSALVQLPESQNDSARGSVAETGHALTLTCSGAAARRVYRRRAERNHPGVSDGPAPSGKSGSRREVMSQACSSLLLKKNTQYLLLRIVQVPPLFPYCPLPLVLLCPRPSPPCLQSVSRAMPLCTSVLWLISLPPPQQRWIFIFTEAHCLCGLGLHTFEMSEGCLSQTPQGTPSLRAGVISVPTDHLCCGCYLVTSCPVRCRRMRLSMLPFTQPQRLPLFALFGSSSTTMGFS